jgi:integrase
VPKYRWDIKDLLFEEDVRKMYNAAPTLQKKAYVSVCWLTGARTGESIQLKKEDVGFNDDFLELRLPTLKLGGGDYKTSTRTLTVTREKGVNSNLYVETVIKYAAQLSNNEDFLFSSDGKVHYTTRWAESKVIGPLGLQAVNKWLTPYHFRHSCMQWLARHGASLAQLMHFKGAKSPLSVQPYISAVPSVVKMENLHRERALEQKPEVVVSQMKSEDFAKSADIQTSPTQEESASNPDANVEPVKSNEPPA